MTTYIRSYIDKLKSQYRNAGSWQVFLFQSSLTLTATSALSYMLGLVRDKVFAYSLGASSDLDIYNAAFVVPDFLFAVLVTGALSAAFVPIFTDLDEQSKSKSIAYTNQVLSFALTAITVFGIIFAIILPFVAPFLVSGFSPAQQEEYVMVTRLLLLAPLFFTISNTFGNALLSLKGFLWYGLAPVVYNVGIIGGVLLLFPYFGVGGLVVGTVIGAMLHMGVRAQSMYRYGFRPHFALTTSPEILKTGALMVPKMVQIGMWQVMLWWFVNLASQTGEGGVTQYNFAYNFQSMPVSLIGIAIALAAYSRLSHVAAKDDYQLFGKIVRQESLKIAVITTLAAIALAIISYPLVNILLGGGKFTLEAVRITASLLAVYAVSVPLESLMHLLARAHYSLQNTLRPSVIHVIAIILSIIVSGVLLPLIGLYALPIAFTTGFLFQDIFLGISLWQFLRLKKRALT